MISFGPGNDPYQTVRLWREGGGLTEAHGGDCSFCATGLHVLVLGPISKRYVRFSAFVGPWQVIMNRLNVSGGSPVALNAGRMMATARSRWATRRTRHRDKSFFA